jgi:branched-chain amino acid transport system substrate-binding protein
MRRLRSRIFLAAIGIPLLLTFLAACGAGTGNNSNNTGSQTYTIKIGTDFPASGKDESSGKPAQNGAQIAVNDANAEHLIPGVTFVLEPKDDVGPSGAHDPDIGQKNVQDLIGDAQVAGIVGPFNSNVAQAEMPIANQAPIALISPSNTNDCLTQTTPETTCGPAAQAQAKLKTYRPTGKVTYFRIATRDFYQGSALADYSYQVKGYRKVYVVDDAETYGVGLADSFSTEWQKLGGTILGHQSEPGTTTSFVGVLTQIAATHPDFIFFGGTDATGGTPLRQQMLQVPALQNTPMVGGDGIVTSAFARTIGHTGGPVYGSVATVDATGGTAASTSAAKAFLNEYAKDYGLSNISAYSASAYDCAMIIMQAVKAAMASGAKPAANSSDSTTATQFRQAVINAIQHISYNGVTGRQAFDQNGDTTSKIITIYTISQNPNQGDGWDIVQEVNESGK